MKFWSTVQPEGCCICAQVRSKLKKFRNNNKKTIKQKKFFKTCINHFWGEGVEICNFKLLILSY